jgi:hypothetical protein
MKGKKVFTKQESQEIVSLINAKVKASSTEQKGIRNKIRKKGFYASDFGLSGGYTSKDFISAVTIIGGSVSSTQTLIVQKKEKPLKSDAVKKDSDENYVLNICDGLLNLKGSRQHRFLFLVGDSGTKLPVDIYYQSLNLVVEYREKQHTEEVKFFDRRQTVSGVGRGEQRKIYDQRRRDVLPKYGITLIEICYSDFNYDSRKRILRDTLNDTAKIKKLLNL